MALRGPDLGRLMQVDDDLQENSLQAENVAESSWDNSSPNKSLCAIAESYSVIVTFSVFF